MPNWILNKISANKDYDEIIDKLTTDSEVDFNNIIPMPDNIYQGNLGQKEREIYNENNWYDWSIRNWGVKWNACNTCVNDSETYFDTPWDGVPNLIYELAKMFPDTIIEYKFADEDMFMNTGIFKFKGKTILRADFNNYNYSAYKVYNDLWGKDPYYDYRVYVSRDGLSIVRIDIVRRPICPVNKI